MGGSAPKPADPIKTASAQTATNIGTAVAQSELNNVNQVTPDGNLTYSQTGTYKYKDPLTGAYHEIPKYTTTQTYSPQQTKINNANKQAQLNLAELASSQSSKINKYLANPFDVNSLGDAPVADFKNLNLSDAPSQENIQKTVKNTGNIKTGYASGGNITKTYGTDFSADRQRVESALMERLNPSIQKDKQEMERRLAEQGIRMGSEAYSSAMQDMGRNNNDARLGVILAGGGEQSRLADLEAQRAGFENQAQQQGYNQNATSANFNNQAQQQKYAQAMGIADLNNSAYQLSLGATDFNNKNKITKQNDALTRYQALLAGRNAGMAEQFAVRNQPINEISALLGSTQVTNPSFITPNVGQIANTDYAGIQANYDDIRAKQQQAKQALYGQIAGSAIGAGAKIYTAGA